MTGSDLIVLAPWLVFVVALSVVCLLLLRSTRASGPRRSLRGRRPRRARRSRRRHDPQEEQCREKNAEEIGRAHV